MEYKDYYKILGVSRNASEADIKKAFRGMARQYHPDLNPSNRSAEDRFKEINEAYEVLGDPEKRRKYDEMGSEWERIRQDREYARKYARPGFEKKEEAFDLGDFFSTFFGERPGGFGPDNFGLERRSGGDIQYEIGLTLEEVSRGAKKPLVLSVGEVCSSCGGRGMIFSTVSAKNRKGTVRAARACPDCGGSGQISSRREIQVTIPKGLTDGSKIRLAGLGHPGIGGGKNGDLYLSVRILPHAFFSLKGFDLEAELPLWADEAALGIQLPVPTLEGNVILKIPPGSQSGQRLRLAQKGLPRPQGTGAGDLYYSIRVVLPDPTGAKEREIYEELRRLRLSGEGGKNIRGHWKS